MYNNGMARSGSQQQQQHMYPGSRGYGAMPGQFQPSYNANGFNSGYNQQQGANDMTAYQQQQQQFQAGYNQQHSGYPQQQQQQQQWYPNGQAYDQSNWSQQQQQHMGWNTGLGQWNGQQQPNNWTSNMSPRNETATPSMYNTQQIPAPSATKDAKRGSSAGTSESNINNKNVEMQPEAYQRTLEYVQQCQSWSSPDSSQPGGTGAKPKRSPPQAAGAPSEQVAGVMPPPMAGAMTPRPAEAGAASNMILGDMSSSMNILNEETRFLHMMQ